jgi:hypothetical protein
MTTKNEIRALVTRTRQSDKTQWTAEILDRFILLTDRDFPDTEEGRLDALNWAHSAVISAIAEAFGVCLACNGTGHADNAGHRCGLCKGRGAL